MKITQEEKREKYIAQLIKKIDNIDTDYLDSELDLVSKKQPFLISLLLGYRIDLKIDELEEMIKIILLIWEYFKNNDKIMKIKVTEKQFEEVQKRNIYMLKYLERERGQNAQISLIKSDLNHLHSKELLTGLIFQFNNKKSLARMKNEEKGGILIGVKSLIECFDEILRVK